MSSSVNYVYGAVRADGFKGDYYLGCEIPNDLMKRVADAKELIKKNDWLVCIEWSAPYPFSIKENMSSDDCYELSENTLFTVEPKWEAIDDWRYSNPRWCWYKHSLYLQYYDKYLRQCFELYIDSKQLYAPRLEVGL
ncbi:MAG: hypothetical protein HOC79_05725 [Euryarchaeota archaeon]|jgi:hypothetical protein|nr:hypothetical protein [Euryarchaeota archaeon]